MSPGCTSAWSRDLVPGSGGLWELQRVTRQVQSPPPLFPLPQTQCKGARPSRGTLGGWTGRAHSEDTPPLTAAVLPSQKDSFAVTVAE